MEGAASFLDSAADQKQMSSYGDKVLPFKRKILNRVRSVMIEDNTKNKETFALQRDSKGNEKENSRGVSPRVSGKMPDLFLNRILENYYYDLVIDDNCDMCFACIGMCPTGALKSNEHESINEETTPLKPPLERGELKRGMLFNASFCNGCGLCSDFCAQSSINIKQGFSGDSPFEERRVKKEKLNEQ